MGVAVTDVRALWGWEALVCSGGATDFLLALLPGSPDPHHHLRAGATSAALQSGSPKTVKGQAVNILDFADHTVCHNCYS